MSALLKPRACVAGWPIGHSRSPLIHGYWLQSLGIAGSYDKAAVPPGEFAAFASQIGQGDLVGANVTVPHKEAAFAVCDELTANAEGLGAVNTLWRENGSLCGDNTDVGGFLANLEEQAPGWSASTRSAVVLGAGGAARAIIQGLIGCGVERIVIVNRTLERAERLLRNSGALRRLRPGARSRACFPTRTCSSTQVRSAWSASPLSILTLRRFAPKRSSPISSIFRWRLLCWRAPERAATARWKGLACCCTRRFRVSSAGSACARKSHRNCAR